jgi:hypothetical protein
MRAKPRASNFAIGADDLIDRLPPEVSCDLVHPLTFRACRVLGTLGDVGVDVTLNLGLHRTV